MNKFKTAFCALIFAIFIFIIYLFFTLSYNTQPTINVKIGYQQTSLYQHIFVAYEKSFFKEESLDVQLKSFASGNQIMTALLANQIDVAGLTNMEVALSVESKDPNKFKIVNFLVWNKNKFPDYIIVRKDSKIKSVKDLEGKTIGLHPGSAVRGFAIALFKHFNLDMGKIQTIELKPEIMQSVITAKRVDALYCMDPVATDILSKGEGEIFLSNPLSYLIEPPIPISGTAISQEFLNNHPALAVKITNAINKAIEFIRNPSNKEEIAVYISKYTPISKELALRLNPSEYWLSNDINAELVQNLSKKFFDLGIVEKEINVKRIIKMN